MYPFICYFRVTSAKCSGLSFSRPHDLVFSRHFGVHCGMPSCDLRLLAKTWCAFSAPVSVHLWLVRGRSMLSRTLLYLSSRAFYGTAAQAGVPALSCPVPLLAGAPPAHAAAARDYAGCRTAPPCCLDSRAELRFLASVRRCAALARGSADCARGSSSCSHPFECCSGVYAGTTDRSNSGSPLRASMPDRRRLSGLLPAPAFGSRGSCAPRLGSWTGLLPHPCLRSCTIFL